MSAEKKNDITIEPLYSSLLLSLVCLHLHIPPVLPAAQQPKDLPVAIAQGMCA